MIAGTFLMYATVIGVGFVFIAKLVPETKGKSLEEIQSLFHWFSSWRSYILKNPQNWIKKYVTQKFITSTFLSKHYCVHVFGKSYKNINNTFHKVHTKTIKTLRIKTKFYRLKLVKYSSEKQAERWSFFTVILTEFFLTNRSFKLDAHKLVNFGSKFIRQLVEYISAESRDHRR